MKLKIEIKNRWTGKVIFEFETEKNTVGKTIAEYVRQANANLSRPTLAMPTLAMPTLAVPTLAVPTLAVPTLAMPTLAMPTLAVPTLAVLKWISLVVCYWPSMKYQHFVKSLSMVK